MEKQYFIYLTINLCNNKKYIGYHFGYINDNYLGSGVLLTKAIEKYGKENFQRSILEICPDKATALQQEQFWIQQFNAVNDEMFYNISEGGEMDAGWHQCQKWARQHPEEAMQTYQQSGQRLRQWVDTHPEEAKRNTEIMIQASKQWREENPEKVKQQMQKVNQAKEKWQQEHPEEHQAQVNRWREAGSIANSQVIQCITTGEIFPSISEAARVYSQYGCHQANLTKVLKGERKTCGKKDGQKLYWKYLEN